MNSPIYFTSKCRKINRYGAKILQRVAAAIKFLAKKKQLERAAPLRNLENSSPANFLASLKFLSEFDDVLRLYLEMIEFGKHIICHQKFSMNLFSQ